MFGRWLRRMSGPKHCPAWSPSVGTTRDALQETRTAPQAMWAGDRGQFAPWRMRCLQSASISPHQPRVTRRLLIFAKRRTQTAYRRKDTRDGRKARSSNASPGAPESARAGDPDSGATDITDQDPVSGTPSRKRRSTPRRSTRRDSLPAPGRAFMYWIFSVSGAKRRRIFAASSRCCPSSGHGRTERLHWKGAMSSRPR